MSPTEQELMRELIDLTIELAPRLSIGKIEGRHIKAYEISVGNSTSIAYLRGWTQTKAISIRIHWGATPIEFRLKPFTREARMLQQALKKARQALEARRAKEQEDRDSQAAVEALQRAVDALRDLRF